MTSSIIISMPLKVLTSFVNRQWVTYLNSPSYFQNNQEYDQIQSFLQTSFACLCESLHDDICYFKLSLFLMI